MKISAFFPAYNEAQNVGGLAVKTSKVLSGLCDEYEVIVVNDGSKDNTIEVVEAVMKSDPSVKLINHEKNKGYGGAVRTGLSAAKYEWVFFTDGDGQFDVAEIPLLVELSKSCDLAVGYRIKRADPFIRKVNAFMWGTLVKLLLGFRVKDVDCAFKLIKKEVIERAALESEGALISTELLAKAARMGYIIKETGVNHYPRRAGTQTGANPRVILRAFVELFKFYGKMRSWGK
ncbi:MAG TPA: glycosyltransferase family 2 protein [bacterium]|nr:glycosyltransferase family 2 protein [bacterium]